jgi:hypothetical protein
MRSRTNASGEQASSRKCEIALLAELLGRRRIGRFGESTFQNWNELSKCFMRKNMRPAGWPRGARDRYCARRAVQRLQRMADVHRDARPRTIGHDDQANRRQTRHDHHEHHRGGELPHRVTIKHERGSHLSLCSARDLRHRPQRPDSRRARCTAESDDRLEPAGMPRSNA